MGLVLTVSIDHLKCGSKSKENGSHFFIVVPPSVTSFPRPPVVAVIRSVSQRHPTQLAEAHDGSNAIVVPVVEAGRNVPPSIKANVRRDVGNSVRKGGRDSCTIKKMARADREKSHKL